MTTRLWPKNQEISHEGTNNGLNSSILIYLNNCKKWLVKKMMALLYHQRWISVHRYKNKSNIQISASKQWKCKEEDEIPAAFTYLLLSVWISNKKRLCTASVYAAFTAEEELQKWEEKHWRGYDGLTFRLLYCEYHRHTQCCWNDFIFLPSSDNHTSVTIKDT